MNVLEVFTGNPLNTPVGQRIDHATDGSQELENWGLNMEICDIINETDEGPKDAIRAIKKKLSNSVGREWRSVSYTLTVLETCVKNCGKRFHIQVATKDFLTQLVGIIAPKNEPSVAVQDKILSLIQTWADAFRGSSELKEVEKTYQELKSKGIDFPMTDLDNLAPIYTPKSTIEPNPISSPSRQPSSRQQQHRAPPQQTSQTVSPSGPIRPAPDQLAKLKTDLDLVQGNCRVFNEMLNACTPGSPELTPDNTELIRELNRTCRQMQQRVVVLIEQVADEQVTEVLLRVNDDLNNAFLRFDRLERNMAAAHSQSPGAAPAVPAAPPANESLIDLGPSESDRPDVTASALAAQIAGMEMTGSNVSNITEVPAAAGGRSDDFDMFAQSRQYDAPPPTSTQDSYTFQQEDQMSGALGSVAHSRSNPYASESSQRPVTATSSEFDQFLAERAAAGESLPDKSEQQETTPNVPTRGGRQMNKEDTENTLFAL